MTAVLGSFLHQFWSHLQCGQAQCCGSGLADGDELGGKQAGLIVVKGVLSSPRACATPRTPQTSARGPYQGQSAPIPRPADVGEGPQCSLRFCGCEDGQPPGAPGQPAPAELQQVFSPRCGTPRTPQTSGRGPAPGYASLQAVHREPADIHPSAQRHRTAEDIGDGCRYSGQWVGLTRHGHGALERDDGSCYVGGFHANLAHGRGKYTSASGDVYDGDWLNDEAHGYGSFTHADGSSYEGEWRANLKHGQGVERWHDGSNFSGEFFHGRKHGFGTFTGHDGSSYSGQFQSDEMEGQGTCNFKDGRVYTGQWTVSQMHGEGEIQSADGSMYQGQYIDGHKDGLGSFWWPSGLMYEGEWSKGKQHGDGVLTENADGTSAPKRRRGRWVAGKRTEWLD